MNILGINAYHGDASACLLVDGVVAVAIEEERLRRIKHWAGFPSQAVRSCLAQTGLTWRDIDHVAVGRDPAANFLGKLRYALLHRPSFSLFRDRLANMGKILDMRTALCKSLDIGPTEFRAPIHGVEHHLAHVASSYYPSTFDSAICVSVDGSGDFVSTLWAVGVGERLHVAQRILFPHSLGVFYSAGTQFLGFRHFGDEYKVMGLAPYGESDHADIVRRFIELGPRGTFRLSLDLFRHPDLVIDTHWDDCAPRTDDYFSEEWAKRLGPPRCPGETIEARHRAVARSLQTVFEEVYLHVLDHAATLHTVRDLCLAGGCAMNSVANGKVLDRTGFNRLHVHPAPGDAGIAVGSAYWVWHEKLGRPRLAPADDPFLGPRFDDATVRRELLDAGLEFEWLEDEEVRIRETVRRLIEGDVVGWFQGRAEWGPRALGNRSILADPRRSEMKETLNAKIKRRESFRPFAPAVLEERAGELFEHHHPSPFMNQVYVVRPSWRARLPAVTHVDGTGRLQTVSRSANPLFHRLIEAFAESTGVPALLNTSFNENEPLVHTPAEAMACFARSEMDLLVIGPSLVHRRPTTRP